MVNLIIVAAGSLLTGFWFGYFLATMKAIKKVNKLIDEIETTQQCNILNALHENENI